MLKMEIFGIKGRTIEFVNPKYMYKIGDKILFDDKDVREEMSFKGCFTPFEVVDVEDIISEEESFDEKGLLKTNYIQIKYVFFQPLYN